MPKNAGYVRESQMSISFEKKSIIYNFQVIKMISCFLELNQTVFIEEAAIYARHPSEKKLCVSFTNGTVSYSNTDSLPKENIWLFWFHWSPQGTRDRYHLGHLCIYAIWIIHLDIIGTSVWFLWWDTCINIWDSECDLS